MQRVKEISDMVENRLLQFGDFLRVKAQRSMNSYLEEFPGLVHFLHIDRSTGRIIAPYITNESSLIPKDKVCVSYFALPALGLSIVLHAKIDRLRDRLRVNDLLHAKKETFFESVTPNTSYLLF